MYTTGCNRKFYTLKEKQPNDGEKIVVHTKDDEAISVKCLKLHDEFIFENIDFHGTTDIESIKGWNYFNAL